MKCKICNHQIKDKKYKYCPQCGSKIDSALMEDEYNVDRLRYILGQDEGGKFLYNTFTTAKYMGSYQWKKVKQVRKKLDDFSHIEFESLRYYSLLYGSPKTALDLYTIGKFLGHCSVGEALKSTKIEALVNTLGGTKLFWKCFENKLVQKMFTEGYRNIKAMEVRLLEIDRNEKKLRWGFNETPFAIVSSPKPVDYIVVGCLVGQCEVIFNGIWNGIETKCEACGDSMCEVEVFLHEKEQNPELSLPTRDELEHTLNDLITFTVSRDKVHRKNLGNYFHISVDQCMNYMLLSLSPGHVVLSKHSGVLCGEHIAKKAGLESEGVALDYARDLFLYLKAGILHKPETRGDSILLKMDESVYSSGVNNINMKLDIFLAGIIEGLLNQSTGERWQVHETKCLANGDEYCEFMCRKQNQ